MKNIQNVDAYKKGYIDFLPKKPLSLKNGQICPQNCFLQFPQKILLFLKKLFNIKIFTI